jgi:SMODS-associating 2TM, beta-strand rich effector domain
MHPYATDSNERQKVTFGLAVLAVGVAWGLSRLFTFLHLTVPWWLDAPSTMGIFGIFYAAFDNVLWRQRWVHRMGLVKVPLLEGKWQGCVRSSFDQHAVEHQVSVNIRQSWTRISLILESANSTSQTLVGSLQVDTSEGRVLSYQYRNEPKPGALGTMQIHYGTARLVLRDATILDGDYYSGRGRQEYGSIILRKVQ